MRVRPPAALLLAVAAVGALLLSGCSAGSTPTPSAPTATVVVPAGATEFGLPAGTGPVTIDLWTDLSCPYCRALEAATGEMISAAVAAGDATLVLHPLNFVSAAHGDSTNWSTRAAGALAATVDAGESERVPAFYALLQKHQTLADETTHPTDADILSLAAEAGVTSDLSDAVETQRFAGWVQASNDHWLGQTIAGTEQVITGVPILVVDGTVIPLDGDVVENLKAALG